ncbi:hypothetical protein N2152v2_003779 [Parachlorella kessleri]
MQSALGGMDQNAALEASLKEFLARPENKGVLEKHQRKEFKQALQLQEKQRALQFREKVLESEYDAQKAVAPFLGNRVLRRIVQSLANDPRGDFSKWALNPAVLQLLREAKKRMEDGLISEEEMEQVLVRQLQDPANPAHEEFARKTHQVVRLPTDQLVGALNEHLTERRQGNDFYRQGNFRKALYHYKRAAGVTEFVMALSRADQEEVDVNKLAAYLNIAAAYMGLQARKAPRWCDCRQGERGLWAQLDLEYGSAISFCSKALAVDPRSAKALLRRLKARIAWHDYEGAGADLQALRELDPWSPELAAQAQALQRARQEDKRKEQAVFANMFDRAAAKSATAAPALQQPRVGPAKQAGALPVSSGHSSGTRRAPSGAQASHPSLGTVSA